MKRSTIALGLSLWLSAQMVHAAVPSSITVQGKLTDSQGSPLPPGTKTLQFEIYDAEVGGLVVWPPVPGEIQVVTSNADGLWSARVGAILPLTDNVFADTVRWLEITYDPSGVATTLPRVRLVTGSFAYRVATVDGASGGTITSKVSIGAGHTNTGTDGFVAGTNNAVSGDRSVVGGGQFNYARGMYSVIGGGGGYWELDSNSVTADWAVIAGGAGHRNGGEKAAICGGQGNVVDVNGYGAFVGGGTANRAQYIYSTIVGGTENQASGYASFIGGGGRNKARGSFSVVGGGGALGDADSNRAGGSNSAVLGGNQNIAEGDYSTIGGGYGNLAWNQRDVIAGGDSNFCSGPYSFVGGGKRLGISGAAHSVIGGGEGSVVFGGSHSFIGGGQICLTSANHAVVCGGNGNGVTSDVASVVGGTRNYIDGNSGGAFIGGGFENYADGFDAVIGGGFHDSATGDRAVVCGGLDNDAVGNLSFVGGGDLNRATGGWACIPGGGSNLAAGDFSFAAGRQARASHNGAFVWGDNTAANVASTAVNQFIVRASGGMWLGTTSTPSIPAGDFLSTSTGAHLTTGGVWTNSSDAACKENFTPIDGVDLLKRVEALPITRWNYKIESESTRHIGPMAQDFNALFGVGSDDKSISTIDPAGVALAAIQALAAKLQQKDAEIAALMARVAALEKQ